MSLPTVTTLDPTWAKVFAGLERGPAHVTRTTTSSRHPGALIQGVVVSRGGGARPCPDCGTVTFCAEGLPHAPRFVDGVQRDCAGRLVP